MPPQKTTRQQPTKRKSLKSDTSTEPVLSQKERDEKQERANRKRVQNRISQQCVREKQLAQKKQLEAMKMAVKNSLSSDATTDAASQRAALNQHISLLDENRELRDALLRMRKKLLSLSSASAAIANDRIFEQVLEKKPGRSPGWQGESGATEGQAVEEPDISEVEDTVFNGPQPAAIGEKVVENHEQPLDLDGMTFSPIRHEEDNQSFQGLLANPSMSIPEVSFQTQQNDFGIRPFFPSDGSVARAKTVPDCSIETPPFIYEDFAIADPDIQDWGTYSNMSSSANHPIKFFSKTVACEIPTFSVSLGKSWKIEEACLLYLAHELGISDSSASPSVSLNERTRYNSLRSHIASARNSEELILDVARVGTDMMAKSSGFSDYVYGIGANSVMEKVLRFRLCPTADNRAAIPEPFAPTALQIMNINYPIGIDWLNWPSIRDQCLLKADFIDFGQLCADIVANTVIEIPEFGIAVNIHDTFFTRVFRNAAESNLAELGLRTVYDEAFEMNQPGNMTPSWATPYLVYHIDKNVNILKERRNISCGARLHSAHVRPLSSKWRLDRLAQWKLSKEFADKYSFLDCTGVTSSYPMFASRTVPDPPDN